MGPIWAGWPKWIMDKSVEKLWGGRKHSYFKIGWARSIECTGGKYKCSSQSMALARCQVHGMRLCTKKEIPMKIGDLCRWMWTSEHSVDGYYLGGGGGHSGCGDKGKLMTSHAQKYDAACCAIS